jgi:hypothetical protein
MPVARLPKLMSKLPASDIANESSVPIVSS